jgi:UDP-glucuronate 4-epimerase
VSRILVTGAAGFIGSRLTEKLSERGDEVIGVDCFLPELYSAEMKKARFEQLRGLSGVELHELDLKTDDLGPLGTFDVVVNQAAMAGLTKAWDNLDLYITNNLMALDRLLGHARSVGVSQFVQISTSSVYGRMAEVAEDGPTEPFSPYGMSKLAAEKLGLAYFTNFDFPFTALRYFSVYGPGHRPDMAYHRFLVASRDHTPITIYGDGEQRRTNTYVDDCVQGTISAIDKAKPGEVYNISGTQSYSLNEALDLIREITGVDIDVHYEDVRAGDQRETRGVIDKAVTELGYNPTWTLRDGLTAEWEWIKTLPAQYSQRS